LHSCFGGPPAGALAFPLFGFFLAAFSEPDDSLPLFLPSSSESSSPPPNPPS